MKKAHFLLLMLFAVMLMALLLQWNLTTSRQQFKKVDEVVLQSFSHINRDLSHFVQSETPVVVRNNQRQAGEHLFPWSALAKSSRWSKQYFLKRFGNAKLYAMNSHSHRLFMYYNEDRAMAEFIPRRSEDAAGSDLNEHAMLYSRVIEKDVLLKELIHAIEEPKGPEPYVYYSQPLKNDLFLNDLQPLSILQVTETGKSVNLWIGGQRSTAQAHFDAFHNSFVQIVGSKTFTLYPPDQWLYMYLHSRHHPSYRQSQLNFQEDNWEHLHDKYPLSNRLVTPYRVTLHEGDFLYLPPYWFHHVEASQELSVSVNVWTDCKDGLLYEKMISSPLPFEENWSPEQLLGVGREYISLIIKKLIKDYPSAIEEIRDVSTPKEYIKLVIISSRYQYLFQESTVPQYMHCWFDSNNLARPLWTKLDKYSDNLVQIATQIQPAMRDMLVGNYIEDLVLYLTQDVRKVGSFLNSCF